MDRYFLTKQMRQSSTDKAGMNSVIFSTPQEKKTSSEMTQRMISSEPRLTATFNHGSVIRGSMEAIYRSTPLHPLLKARGVSSFQPRQQVNQLHHNAYPSPARQQQQPSDFSQNNYSAPASYGSNFDAFGNSGSYHHQNNESMNFPSNSHTSNHHNPAQIVQNSPHHFDESLTFNRTIVPPSAQNLSVLQQNSAPSSSSSFRSPATQQQLNQLHGYPSPEITLVRQHQQSSSESSHPVRTSHQQLPNESAARQFVLNQTVQQYSPHYFEESPSVNRNAISLQQASVPSSSAFKSTAGASTTIMTEQSSSSSQSQSSLPLNMEPLAHVPVKRSQRTGNTVLLSMGQAFVEQKHSLPPPAPPSTQNAVVNEQVPSVKKRSDQLSSYHFSQMKSTSQSSRSLNDGENENTLEQPVRSSKSGGKSKSQPKSIPEAEEDYQASDEDTKAASKKRKRTLFSSSSSLHDQTHQEEPTGKPTRSGRISKPIQRLPGVLDAITHPDTSAGPAPPKSLGNNNNKRKAEAMAVDKRAANANANTKFVSKKTETANKRSAWDDLDDIDTNYPQAATVVPVRKWEKEETVALYNVHSLSDLKNPNFWLDIANSMQRLGYHRSEEECNQKWNEGINLMFERKSKKIAKDKMKIEERCLEKLSHNSNTAIMVGKTAALTSVKDEANDDSGSQQPQAKKRQVLGKNDKKILLQHISKATREDDIFDSNEFKSRQRTTAASSPLVMFAGMDELPTPPVTHGSFLGNRNEQGKHASEPLFQRDNVQKFKRIKPQLIASLAPMNKPMTVKKKGRGHALNSTGNIRREIDRAVKKSRVDVLGSSDEDIEEEEVDDDGDDDYDEELAKQRRIYSHHDDDQNDDEEEAEEETNSGIEHDL